MSLGLRERLFIALAGLLLVTVLAAWTLTTGAVLRPLFAELRAERVEMAVYIAKELEEAEDPDARAEALSQELAVRLEPAPTGRPPPPGTVLVHRGGRRAAVLPGPRAPVAVEVHRAGRERWLLVHFTADLDAPPRRMGLALLLLLGTAVVLAWAVVERALRPLGVATAAMERIAGGELQHRVDERGPVAEVGKTFNHMAEQVQGIVRGQQQWMAAVSHELRTPLSRMRLGLALAKEEAPPGPLGRRLAGLDAEVDEMQALIDDLIASARLEQGLVALRREPTPARELLLEALASVDLGEREVALDAPEDLVLDVDRAYLRRAVVNLLTNVARYTPADARVWIGARVEGGAALLAVEDDGPGLPRGQIDQLFTPFFRAEASRSRATGGLGLGLVVVRQVATLHGGAAGAAASPRGGLRVWLRIPLTRAIHSEGSAPQAART